MARKKRDYKAEYRRRIERAVARGLHKSVARGHPSKGRLSITQAKKLALNPPEKRQLITPKGVEKLSQKEFVEMVLNLGLKRSKHDAYTEWFYSGRA